MKPSELKEFIIRSLDEGADHANAAAGLEEEGINYDFSKGFNDRIIDRISGGTYTPVLEPEFTRYMKIAFNRIALTGIAAIIILLISIFIGEGSLSLDSFLGIGDTYDESIICLLTGN